MDHDDRLDFHDQMLRSLTTILAHQDEINQDIRTTLRLMQQQLRRHDALFAQQGAILTRIEALLANMLRQHENGGH